MKTMNEEMRIKNGRYRKRFLTGISLCAALLVAGGCSSDAYESGTDNGLPDAPVPLTIRATAGSFTIATADDGSNAPTTRTPVVDGLKTQFQPGDAIGVFVISGINTPEGKILDNINNTKLVYTANADGSTGGSWTKEDGSNLYCYAGATYVAYYPYNQFVVSDYETAVDPTKSLAENLTLLDEHWSLKLYGNEDQDTAAKYASADLMTASGTPALGGSDTERVLTLNFEHRRCLLMLTPCILKGCVTPENAGFTYRSGAKVQAPDTEATNVTLNGCKPYETADGSFRVIVKPTTASDAKFSGKYTTQGKEMLYEGNAYTSGFTAGKCYTLTVNSPFTSSTGTTERALAPGDFVFHGTDKIEIYPGNGTLDADGKIPDYSDAVGIVVTCDNSRMTDSECTAAGWSHAYVMGLELAANYSDNLAWSTVDEATGIPQNGTMGGAVTDMNGYSSTEKILADKSDNLSNYPIFNRLNTFRTESPFSGSLPRSPWFIPSVGQWVDVMTNLGGKSPTTFSGYNSNNFSAVDNNSDIWDAIQAHFKKAGVVFANGQTQVCYSASSEENNGRIWITAIFAAKSQISIIEKSNDFISLYPFFAF